MSSYIANRNYLFQVVSLAALVVISAASVYGQSLPATSTLAQNTQGNTTKGIQTGPTSGGSGASDTSGASAGAGSKPAVGKAAPSRAGS